MEKELTPKQQTSEALRQADTILIMTGQHPSIDQVASTVAMQSLLRKFGKKVTTVISDDIPASARFLPMTGVERQMGGLRDFIMQVSLARAEVDKLKYDIDDGKLNIHITPFSGGFQQKDVSFSYGDYQFDAIIVMGVASYARIDKVYQQNSDLLRNIPLINIDYHRSNEQYGAINLIEPAAASLSEVLIALSESLQAGMIDEQIATTMLTGIMAATDRFTAAHTTSKTMTIAAQMMAMGADQQKVVRNLYRGDKPKSSPSSSNTAQSSPSKPVESSKPAPEPAPRPLPVQSVPAPVVVEAPVMPTPAVVPAAQAKPTELFREEPMSVEAVVATEPDPVTPQAPEPQPTRTPEPQTPQALNPLEQPSQPVAEQPAPSEPEPEVEPEVTPDEPVTTDSNDSLLPPPQSEPEPLINDDEPHTSAQAAAAQPKRASNPINNPIFAQRLDELDY